MKQQNHALGQQAESMAALALVNKGYEILERNYQNRFGEIDIIAQDKKTLVFVEVKAKTGIQFGTPEEMISSGKLQKIRRMGSLYMGDKVQACRIDVVAIVLNKLGQIQRLSHYENVC
jgi:putative endonuclease